MKPHTELFASELELLLVYLSVEAHSNGGDCCSLPPSCLGEAATEPAVSLFTGLILSFLGHTVMKAL